MTATIKMHRRADQITTLTLNRQPHVTVDGLNGTLTGILPVGDTVQLAMIVGGQRAWKTVPADTVITIHPEETT